MSLCRATKANGEPCTLPANGPQGLCWAHDPANSERRRRLASHAAKSKRDTPRKQIQEIAQGLGDLYASVLAGDVQPKVAAVAGQVANARIRALDTERRIVEQEEIIGRLDDLERRYGQSGGSRSWG